MKNEAKHVVQNTLPETGLVRLSQICGDKKKGIAPIVPVSKSGWWAGVASGRYPKPIKLGERTTCWRVEDSDNDCGIMCCCWARLLLRMYAYQL